MSAEPKVLHCERCQMAFEPDCLSTRVKCPTWGCGGVLATQRVHVLGSSRGPEPVGVEADIPKAVS